MAVKRKAMTRRGPKPEDGLSGLTKLRKSVTLPADVTSLSDDAAKRSMDRRLSGEFQNSQTEARRLTESIEIKKPPILSSLDTESPLLSPGSFGSSPPISPSVASPSLRRAKHNVWRSVFQPGSNKDMKAVGSDKFDKAQPNSPTIYDWVVITTLDK